MGASATVQLIGEEARESVEDILDIFHGDWRSEFEVPTSCR